MQSVASSFLYSTELFSINTLRFAVIQLNVRLYMMATVTIGTHVNLHRKIKKISQKLSC